ncbi:hypothetical protein Tery_0814 [Trichodesmium erythraeum IMS101]|uniref:Uncharacterized protein n=1 Tax=Trichodesmium erythraeum (strain IMS101) TaxID=203124 RepID=Q117U4_TRIEI|nr:hypothetical protein [Trichodesmium erythraeum GBRTRLIN201]
MDKNTPIYIAISGGGFHSHTAMSAWISGILHHSELESLEQIFENVRGISANSGGSWFMSHLGYSNAFVKSLLEDSQSEKSTWSSSGYLGKMGESFFSKDDEKASDMSIFSPVKIETFLAKYIDLFNVYAEIFPNGNRRWHQFVTTKVYEPLEKLGNAENGFETMKGKKLSETNDRLPWFREKDFVIAAGLLNSKVVLHATGGLGSTNQVYSVNSADGSKLRNFVPMCLSGVANGRKAAPVFVSGPQEVIYSEESKWRIPLTANHPQNLNLLDATIASSSAIAFLASESSIGEMIPSLNEGLTFEWISYQEADFAPPIRFGNDRIEILKTLERASYDEFANQKMARVADGGYLDNTSVVFQLRHMKENGDLKDGFHLVLFVNGSDEGVKYHGYEMNVGIATLFGHDGLSEAHRAERVKKGEKIQPEEGSIWNSPFSDLCMEIPSPHVFETEPLENNTAISMWNWKSKDEKISLQARKIPVTTVENKTYGISAGVMGTIYIFEVTQPESFPMPTHRDILETYEYLFETIRNEACAKNQALSHLKEALALKINIPTDPHPIPEIVKKNDNIVLQWNSDGSYLSSSDSGFRYYLATLNRLKSYAKIHKFDNMYSDNLHHGDLVRIKTTEQFKGIWNQRKLLGAFANSYELYYWSDSGDKTNWIIEKAAGTAQETEIAYGEKVYIKNKSYNQYLVFAKDGYLTTKKIQNPGDEHTWVIHRPE